ncbi:MAG TPA: hypothetical protein VFJ98_05545, partial [Mycobacteriales bacterium]|nr:hypothetical protein [Mycobacteriales bacterium]
QDALPAAHAMVTKARPPVMTPSVVLHEGELRTATSVLPAGTQLPTQRGKMLALVLVPKTGDGPTWVFPFDKPTPPGIGDNQALAIATKDGQTVYDVAFALVWADSDGTVGNTNSAYALASCKQCTAVAVAFQVVLVVGDSNAAAPENIAVATTYQCPKCTTVALAVQLMLTLPEDLTPAQRAELRHLWKRIMRWSKHLQGLTLAEIQQQLATYEKKIVAIVDPAAAAAVSSTSTATATPAPTATATVPVTSTAPSTSASDSATASPSASPSSSASDSPSPAPSPSHSASSPGPTPSGSASP